MSNSKRKTTFASNKQISGNRQVLFQQEVENKMLTREEIEAYNDILPEFGKQYLKNQIEIPRELIKEGKRGQFNVSVAVYIVIFMLLFYFLAIGWLFYKQQYQYGTYILGGGIGAVVVSLLISITSKAKKIYK